MRLKPLWMSAAVGAAALVVAGPHLLADEHTDWGLIVQQQLRANSWELFGIRQPLTSSALGPFTGPDSTKALKVASSLHVSLVSSAVQPSTDMIAMWPDDVNPTHLYVCDESTSNPAVQRVDLSHPPGTNATTILIGLSSCDPIRRTPWGTIVAAEESTTGGLYELINPASVVAPITVLDRANGTTSDPRLVKRKAVGQLAFEGQAILPDGTMYFGDELAPGNGAPGGSIYKFVPTFPLSTTITITDPTLSPFAAGKLYGLRVGVAGNNGQGAEIGNGRRVLVDPVANPSFLNITGNIVLRTAQTALKFTGYYRPEDMDLDPIAWTHHEVRMCWAHTGRISNGGGSDVENDAIYGEVMCLTDQESSDPAIATGSIPLVTRLVPGYPHAAMYDNVSFQPHTGNLVILEDGATDIVKDGVVQPRGNDIWMCLPDGDDDDVQTDGCIRIASLRDTDSEPTGFIFTASGETAFVSLQHRGTTPPAGALVKISGFRVHPHHSDRDDDDDFFGWHGRRHW